MPGIFISYRRKDSLPLATRLAKLLQHQFGKDRVFFDESHLTPGTKWEDKLRLSLLEKCDILLVLAGPLWIDEVNDRRQKLDEQDWVHEEVFTGLARNIHVVPVLFRDAADDSLPRLTAKSLPPDLKRLSDLQYHELKEITIQRDRNGYATECDEIPKRVSDQLIEVLANVTTFDLLRTGIETAQNQFALLNASSTGEMENLIAELRQAKVSTTLFQSDESDDNRINLYYCNKRERKEVIVKIIEIVGKCLGTQSQTLSEDEHWSPERNYVFKQLEGVLEIASSQLAALDRADEGTAGDEDYGYLRLVEMAVYHSKADDDSLINFAGKRALAYYLEFRNPTVSWGKVSQIFHTGRPKTLNLGPQNWFSLWGKVYGQQFWDTWNEFVSAEVVGGLLIVLIMAFAFALHTVMTQSFTTLQPPTGIGLGGSNICFSASWNESPCLRGLFYEFFFWVTMVGMASALVSFYSRRIEHRNIGFLWKAIFTASMGIAALVGFMLLNDQATKNFNGVNPSEFLVGFLAASAVVLPGSIMMLAITGWSSVIVGERRVRRTPDVQGFITLLAVFVCMGLTFFLLAAVVEKSRPHWTESVFLGLLWGAVLGGGIWGGRSLVKQFERHSGWHWLIRLGTVLLSSVILTLILGILSASSPYGQPWWPRYNQFVAIPALITTSDQIINPVFRQWVEINRDWIGFERLIWLGIWVGTAIFFGVELMNNKMMDVGQGKVELQETEATSEADEFSYAHEVVTSR